MAITFVSTLSESIVSVSEVKVLARVLDTTFDTLIADHITQAQAQVQAIMGRQLSPQTWKLTRDAFCDAIQLPKGPVTGVASVSYYDLSGALQTVSPDAYTLDLVSDPQWIIRNDGYDWPATLDAINAVEITFTVGYGNPADPAYKAAQQAVRALALHWYENGGIGEIPAGVRSIIFPFTNHGF